MSVLYHCVMELQFQVHIGQDSSRSELTGPIIVPPGFAAKALDCGFTKESVYSRQPKTVVFCQVWSCSSYQLKPGARTVRVRQPL